MGKHGNLEWLPGKAVGLSPTCWPEAICRARAIFTPSSSMTQGGHAGQAPPGQHHHLPPHPAADPR